MARLRYNNSLGTLGASLTSNGTTITFASAPSFATIVAPDYIPLVLEPPSTSPSGNFEIVYVTAYTAGATTGTISRGQENTTGVAHSNGVAWLCGPTAQDAAWLIENVNVVTASGATQTIPDVTTATENLITLSANCTLTFPTVATGKQIHIALQQDATGSRTVTWPTNIKWSAGTLPTLSTSANVTDYLDFVCLDGTNWLGVTVGLNLRRNVAPDLTGTANASSTTTSSGSLVVPGTTVVGDTILIAAAVNRTTAPTVPTGFTQLAYGQTANNGAAGIVLWSKTAVAGDIGATINLTNMSNQWIAQLRSYTCGGVDTTSTVATGTNTLAAPLLTTSMANELQATFFSGNASGASGVTLSLAAGSTNQFTTAISTGLTWVFGAEDWALPTSGTQVSGGGATINGGLGPVISGVSVLLKPGA